MLTLDKQTISDPPKLVRSNSCRSRLLKKQEWMQLLTMMTWNLS